MSNPLLEDINLSGACGILVNITAGPNFTMREFEEIGRTIEEFASEDATVVIGTVLDPEIQDDVRVTVVATGLNRQPAAACASGRRHAAPRARREREAVRPSARCACVRNATTGAVELRLRCRTAAACAPASRDCRGRRTGRADRDRRSTTTSTSRRSCAARRTDGAGRGA